MNPELNHSQRGFTIVEIAVVLFLIFLIIIPMAYSIERSLRVSEEIYRANTCAFLAQQKIEEVRMRASCYTTDWGPPAPINCSPSGVRYNLLFNFSQAAAACTFPSPFTKYKCRVVYGSAGAGFPVALANYYKEIEVRVWYDGDGDNTWDASEVDVLFQTALTYHTPAWFN